MVEFQLWVAPILFTLEGYVLEFAHEPKPALLEHLG